MIETALIAATAIACVPTSVLIVELLSAATLKVSPIPLSEAREGKKVAVIVPAHNEEAGLLPTLQGIRAQLPPSGRLLVVADNCTDRTAEIARAAGAEVTERWDPERRGKGYALDWGVHHLKDDPPDVVLIIDADCRLGKDTVDTLVLRTLATGRPVQAQNIAEPSVNSPERQAVLEASWVLKNYVRPLGLLKLGLPCQMMGTGMAFPWKHISEIELGSGNLAEDVKLGLDLAAKGAAPLFCLTASVISAFPNTEAGIINQRRRWEIGSMRNLWAEGPRSIYKALAMRDLNLLVLALDVMVPPLSVLVASLSTLWLLAAIAATGGYGYGSLSVLTSMGIILTGCLLLVWARFGRSVLKARDVRQVGRYLLQKLRIYRWRPGRILHWTRTDRS